MDPVRRVLGLPVLLQPVVERKRSRERSNLFANQLLLLGQLEVHGRDCSPTTSAAPGAGGGGGGEAAAARPPPRPPRVALRRRGGAGGRQPGGRAPAPPPAPPPPPAGRAPSAPR